MRNVRFKKLIQVREQKKPMNLLLIQKKTILHLPQCFLSEVVKRYPHLKENMEYIDGKTHG